MMQPGAALKAGALILRLRLRLPWIFWIIRPQMASPAGTHSTA